jgi:hypothetical protein
VTIDVVRSLFVAQVRANCSLLQASMACSLLAAHAITKL